MFATKALALFYGTRASLLVDNNITTFGALKKNFMYIGLCLN